MAENSLLVSIIIPCYNVADYVQQAIESVLNQDYKNIEVWIIDDASTDSTPGKIKSVNDSRIKMVAFEENTQKIGAVNEVLQQVNGDLIAFQDADDWSEPDRISEQVNEFLKNPSLGICFTGFDFVREGRHIRADKISLTDKELKNEFLNYTYKKPAGTTATNCPAMMISKAALRKTNGYHPYFKGRVAEDAHWIYRILKDFEGITINKCLYHYRVRENSFTGLQSKGSRPKYAYSWHLLAKIIYKDIHEGIDVLAPQHKELLQLLELEACEEALAENIQRANHVRYIYENSTNFKIGKLLLSPVRLISNLYKSLKIFHILF